MTGPAPAEQIADLLCAALGQDAAWRAALTPDTRLDGDLFLDSLELAAFAAALRALYGPAVELPRYVAGLELDELIALTLAQVAGYVAQVTPAAFAAAPPATAAPPAAVTPTEAAPPPTDQGRRA